MNHEVLLTQWLQEEAYPFSGWDFSHLEGRMIQEEHPWSYLTRAAELMHKSSSVVDLNTGGGERFLSLREHWPAKVVATEEYPPNFALATQRLVPHGAQVFSVRMTDYDLMPFANGEFALVLNRHAAFNPAEVARTLAPNGTFLTQQVHGMWAWDLLAAFDAKPQWPNATPAKYVPQLERVGLEIVQVKEWEGKLRFTDVGAIVYSLKATPWLVPGFTVATHQRYLFALQEQLDAGRELVFAAKLYLIEARKPAVPAAQHWRRDLHNFANNVMQSFAARADVHGVALGGSLARGREWQHSDVEMAILVERRLEEFGHFYVRGSRGVEIFQFTEEDLRAKIYAASTDPLAVLDWPIQMYQCRIFADPSGLFAQFKECFDRQLFQPEVVSAKSQRALAAFDGDFAIAQADFDAGRPLTALAQLRAAFNHLILAFYWQHGILPRSQNRTEALLREHCQRLGETDFYKLFSDVYNLDLPAPQARRLLAACRAEVNEIVSGFGPAAADFFYYAVDGEFRWGQTKGILTVYRLYVPLALRRFKRQAGVFDDPDWRQAHHDLCRFVGLDRPDKRRTADLLDRVRAMRARLGAQLS